MDEMKQRQNEDQNFLFKIIVVGENDTGKSHLIHRYIKGSIAKHKFPTTGVEFYTKPVPLKSGGTVKAQIWDTPGSERYKPITLPHYRKSVGALIMYDLTDLESFTSVKKQLKEVRVHAKPDIVIMLVGNKLDLCQLRPYKRRVSTKSAIEFA